MPEIEHVFSGSQGPATREVHGMHLLDPGLEVNKRAEDEHDHPRAFEIELNDRETGAHFDKAFRTYGECREFVHWFRDEVATAGLELDIYLHDASGVHPVDELPDGMELPRARGTGADIDEPYEQP